MIENIDILAILFFSLFLISLIFLFTLKSKISQKDIELAKLSQNLEFLSKKVDDFLKNEQELLKNIANLEEQNIKLKIENSSLNANIDFQKENNQKLKDDLEEQGKKLELKLNEIMQNNLDNKLKKFDETSLKSLDNILKPFKENIDSFQKRVEESQENSTKKFAELSKEIEMLTKAGLNISQEAENLTKALKGKKQTQGSWGEMILESVLEYSGLLKIFTILLNKAIKMSMVIQKDQMLL